MFLLHGGVLQSRLSEVIYLHFVLGLYVFYTHTHKPP